MSGAGAAASAAVAVAERLDVTGGVPLWRHPDWESRFPWLVQATTGAGDPADPFDLGLYGMQPVGVAVGRWAALRRATAMPAVVHARQVHGAEVRVHAGDGLEGLLVMDGFDGHLTDRAGMLLAVSVADCVPIFVLDARTRAVGILHAGWRGVAGGILEAATGRLAERFGSRPADLWVHCGPSICGVCYEVGPEVHAGVHPRREPPARPTPIDLRAALAERAQAAGVPAAQCSLSSHCTRCGPGAFFSHRGGSAARQMGVLGRRA